MKLTELRDILITVCERHPHHADDANVFVETCNGGCPTAYMSRVESANLGFDWTARMFILRTKDRLVVERNITEPLEDLARKKLDDLDSVSIIGGPHVAKNQRRAWIDGYVYGVRAHYTGEEKRDRPAEQAGQDGREP